MEFTAQQISDLLEGSIEGDASVKVGNLSKIEEGKQGTLTFLANPKYTEYIYTTGASIAIVNSDFKPEQSLPESLTLIRVSNAYESFTKLLEFYDQAKKSSKSGVHPTAVVSESASIGNNVYIGPQCFVGENAIVGDNTILEPIVYVGNDVKIGSDCNFHTGVKILDRCEIGNFCEFHAGVVIGGDGFGFSPNEKNFYKKVPQIGNVIVEDHVEIGANTTIDRATLGSTILRKGVKLDNLIQVAHNVEIGENTVIAAQTGIAGSTKIGKNCLFGGQVGIVGHITIADGVKIAAQSGVGKAITEEGAIVQGSPALPIGDFKKSYIGFMRLPEMMKDLRKLNQDK